MTSKISIITVCFNSAETIRATIESVVTQSYPDIEYIIVDGASTDGTLDIIEEYYHDIDCVISEPDKGIYDAMNKGICAASGDVIGILNSDDIYSDCDVIREVAEQFETSSVDSVYADLVMVRRDNADKILRYYSSENFRISRIRLGWMLPHPTFFVRKRCYSDYGLYKLGYRVSADFELITRFLWKERITHKRIPRPIIKMRQGGISSTGFFGRIHQNYEIVRACRENGLYTNIFMVLLKFPFKLLEYWRTS